MRPDLPHPHRPVAGHGRRAATSGLLAFLIACGPPENRTRSEPAAMVDSAPDTRPPAVPDTTNRPPAHAASLPRLSPLADSISGYLVFPMAGENWFTVASRNKRLYLDIGRVDTEVRRDSARALAYREAVAKRSPVPLGTRFRLRGSWGAEDVTATAVDTWNGRIVLRLSASPMLDSLARGKAAFVASAFRTDSVSAAAADSCDRTAPLPRALEVRLGQLRDSLMLELRAGPQPPYQRLQRTLTLASSQVVGCFGPARVALAVGLRAGNVEWVREHMLLVDSAGRATPLRVVDFRFRAHDLLMAFDADGDGVDDLVTRATTERAGATTILVLDPKARRLTRLTAGFAWEAQ